MQFGEKVILQSYKHNGSIHRIWKNETFLYEDDDLIIVANKRTRVVESNGRFWHTKEPSVTFFFKHHWFNVIGIMKKNDIHYYCNISSPVYRDEEAVKYIDYDLDIKVTDDYHYQVLDQNEYNRNQKKMRYPEDIKTIISLEMAHLETLIQERAFPFDKNQVREWFQKFKEYKGV